MKKNLLILFFTSLLLCSCGSSKELSSSEIKQMTTKQFDSNYDIVFGAARSLMQSDNYMLTSSDNSSGLITGYRDFGKKKKLETDEISILIEPINDDLTEVKITMHKRSSQTKTNAWTGQKEMKYDSGTIQDASIYAEWFNNLRIEIERRKAMR